MFDLIPKILASAASFLFPIFASYKALKTSDPAQLTPWLMYWVVFSLALLVESWFEWILVWVPFYSYIRLFFLLYLVLPQTQGARQIYLTYVHPWLEENEAEIEEFIGSLHERMRTAGLAYAKQAVEYLKSCVGLPSFDDPQQQSAQAAGAGNDGDQSYAHSLLARFYLPAARWPGSVGSAPAHPTPVPTTASTDFYGMLQAAVSAATAAAISGTSGGTKAAEAKDLPSKVAPLIPETIRGSKAKMSFITAQREKLGILMSALDREATQLQTEEAAQRDVRAPSISMDGGSAEDEQPPLLTTRPPSGTSIFSAISGLSKSRSEQDFVNLEAESGAEDDMDDGMRRRTPGTPGVAGWMPWNWGSGDGTADQSGKSTSVEK